MIERLVSQPLYATGSRVMLALIGVSILCRILSTLPDVPFLYGELSSVPLPPRSVYTLYAVWSIAALGLIVTRYIRVCALIAVIAYSIDATADLQNAGDYLARIVLIYALLFGERAMRGRASAGLRLFFHNLGVLGVLVQLGVVYLNASLWKLQGPNNFWLDGTMLYYVTHLEARGMVWSRWIFEIPWVVYTATYMTLLYQLSFVPLLLTRWHWVSVLIGVGFHLGIALTLGLVPFGLVMMSLVLFTVRDATWRRLESYLSSLPSRARRFTLQ